MRLLESDVSRLPDALRLRCDREDWDIRPHRLVVPYEHWTASASRSLYAISMTDMVVGDILRAILPEDVVDETPSSFARVGHIGPCTFHLRSSY